MRSEEYKRRWRRRYYLSHRAESLAKYQQWCKKNKEHRKRYMAAYNAKRKDNQKEYDRLRYLRPKNVAKRELLKPTKKAYMRNWLQNNRDKHRLAYAKRRALKRNNGIGDSKIIAAWIRSWQSLKRVKCYWCSHIFPTKKCHVDHVVALSDGGAHSLENLCVSCSTCNMKKHNKPLSIWNQQITEPVLL